MSMTRRVILVAVGALMIVLAFGAVALVRSEGAPAPAPSPGPESGVRTLLLQVLDDQGYARGNVVIGVDTDAVESGSDLLAVPASLLVSLGDDSVTLGTTAQSSDTLAAVTAVEESLRLRIDAGLTLDRLALAGLVDGVGGVWVELDRPVLLPAIGTGERRRVLGPGQVSLDGIAAADYAVLRLPGEGEEERTERLLDVLGKTLARLPVTQQQIRQVLTSLGSLAPSTVPTDELAPLLLTVRTDSTRDRVRMKVLPVDVIRGGVRPAAVGTAEGDALVQELFPTARIAVGAPGVTG
jgi:hypothetical protein